MKRPPKRRKLQPPAVPVQAEYFPPGAWPPPENRARARASVRGRFFSAEAQGTIAGKLLAAVIREILR